MLLSFLYFYEFAIRDPAEMAWPTVAHHAVTWFCQTYTWTCVWAGPDAVQNGCLMARTASASVFHQSLSLSQPILLLHELFRGRRWMPRVYFFTFVFETATEVFLFGHLSYFVLRAAPHVSQGTLGVLCLCVLMWTAGDAYVPVIFFLLWRRESKAIRDAAKLKKQDDVHVVEEQNENNNDNNSNNSLAGTDVDATKPKVS